MNDPIAATRAGQVRGMRQDGVLKFLGVPYAAAPVGARRFRLPQPPVAWEGVREAVENGPNAPQIIRPLDALDGEPLVGAGWKPGDEFLSANIWTLDPPGVGRPVMVFIHGGAFVGGSKDAAVNDGTAFARSGIVCIAINYRMGVEGFLPIPGAPANLGFHDMIAALRWVQDNAAAFGGDPANVTVFGESAGAMAIADLVASPLAEGLFRRAIVQSGHGDLVRSIPVAARLVKRLAKMLKISPDVKGFASRSVEDCLNAQEKVSQPTSGMDLRDERGLEPAFGLSRFLPVYGDDVLPEPPMAALRKGAGAKVDLLIGTNKDEMNIYLVPTGFRRKIGYWLARISMGKSIRNAHAILKAYGLGQKGRRVGDAWCEALTDLVFRAPARAFAAAHKGRTHFYEFGWHSPAFEGEMGACHALDLPFVFDTLASCSRPKGIAGPNPPQELADRIHRIWVDFARDGSLPWPEYEPGQVYSLDQGRMIDDPPMAATRFLP